MLNQDYSLWMWRRVVGWTGTNTGEEHTASIFRVEDNTVSFPKRPSLWTRNLTRHSDLFQYAGMSFLSDRLVLLLMMCVSLLGVRVSKYTMSRSSSCSSCPCMGCWECSSLVSWRTTVSWTAQIQSKYGARVCECAYPQELIVGYVVSCDGTGWQGRAEQVFLGFSAGCERTASES
jgi:hypothetical protein